MTRSRSFIKAVIAGVLWIALHTPLDILIVGIHRTDISAFAITVQVLDIVIISYLTYQYLQHKRLRPWKCVVCDGFGKRHVGPQGEGTAVGSPVCIACQGSGIIWERFTSK
jgi:hypothetical protein